MAYTGNPSTNPVDELRLLLGDLDPDFPWMEDSEYQYFLDKNPTSVRAALVGAGQSILFALTHNVRERTGQIEVYGSEAFNNYRAALKDLLSNPSGALNINPIPFFGGISRISVAINKADGDVIPSPFYRGQTNLRPVELNRPDQILYNDIDSTVNVLGDSIFDG